MKSFIKSLFDFKFETYITKTVASVLYAIVTVIVALGVAAGFIFGLSALGGNYPSIGVLIMVAAPVGGLLVLTVLRVAFESSIALVDIAQNTKKK